MIKENIARIRERILLACSKVKRNPDSITIVAVSKGRTVQEIKEAVEAGITDIGENRIQEAFHKYREFQIPSFQLQSIRWHMVGHLQKNKVKEAVKMFSLIQSVDSLHLAAEIDKQAARINKLQDILIEIKTSTEKTKFGLNPKEAIEIIKEIVKFKNLNLKGLMTIAPLVDNPQKTRPYFRVLRELLDEINGIQVIGHKLQILSMGMTDDFEVAIEEGSNMIRLGRAIFENID